MKYLSLFTGIGGFEIGIQKAYENLSKTKGQEQGGAQGDSPDAERKLLAAEQPYCIGYSEIDKYAVQIYQKHFPKHTNYGDITKINAEELPDFDFLCGGFPCQAFSIAGNRRGFEDTRGTLFFDIARILAVKRPRNFLLENVKGLLSHDEGRTFATIIATLDELGYDVQWQVLNSKNHGVPQNRERVFIVGNLRGEPRPKVFPFRENDAVPGGASESNEGRPQAEISGAIRTGEQKVKADGTFIKVVGTLEGGGWEKRHEQIRRIHGTDGISPTIPTGTGGGVMTKIAIPEATKKGYAEAEIGDSINLSVPGSATRRGRIGKGVAQTLDTGMQQHTLSPDMKIRRLTPTECERLQGFPDGWTDIVSDSQRYKTLGNAVTVNVIRDIMEKII